MVAQEPFASSEFDTKCDRHYQQELWLEVVPQDLLHLSSNLPPLHWSLGQEYTQSVHSTNTAQLLCAANDELFTLQVVSTHLRRLAVEQPDNPAMVEGNSVTAVGQHSLVYSTDAPVVSTSGQQLWFIGMPLQTLHLPGRDDACSISHGIP